MKQAIHVLFVDDIWCMPDSQGIIRAEYGDLQRRDLPYVFHYETASAGAGTYTADPVLTHIAGIPRLDAVILDILFGEKAKQTGLEILSAIREKYPTLPVLMLTTVEKDRLDVVERAMELGANEYLIKKPSLNEMEAVLRIYTDPSFFEADHAIWGNSPAIRKVRAVIARVAAGGTASVLITGESGTGKELVARALHRQGPRRRGAFVDKNCAHEKSDLLDSDLFGHEKGAFTGAQQQHVGRIERANGGTLFLDEIGSMSAELQGKLLRVLETRCFQRLGGKDDITSDFQLVCATNDSPEEMVKDGRLREDLYYRLRQIEIALPPLRERAEDVPILAELFLQRFLLRGGASYRAQHIDDSVLEDLTAYQWPGNVRELRNVIERAVILCRSETITADDLPAEVLSPPRSSVSGFVASNAPLPENPAEWAAHRVKQELCTLEAALERAEWNATVVTKHLFPQINSPNATYLKRYLKRLQESPWGVELDDELTAMVERISNGLGRSKT